MFPKTQCIICKDHCSWVTNFVRAVYHTKKLSLESCHFNDWLLVTNGFVLWHLYHKYCDMSITITVICDKVPIWLWQVCHKSYELWHGANGFVIECHWLCDKSITNGMILWQGVNNFVIKFQWQLSCVIYCSHKFCDRGTYSFLQCNNCQFFSL